MDELEVEVDIALLPTEVEVLLRVVRLKQLIASFAEQRRILDVTVNETTRAMERFAATWADWPLYMRN